MTRTLRTLSTGEALLVDLDDTGAVIGRECRDCRAVHPVEALTTTHGRSRHVCRRCYAERRASRPAEG